MIHHYLTNIFRTHWKSVSSLNCFLKSEKAENNSLILNMHLYPKNPYSYLKKTTKKSVY